MDQRNLNPIFQVTNPAHGKSDVEILQERIKTAQSQNLASQMQRAQEIQGKLDKTSGKSFNKGGAIAAALADIVAPQAGTFNKFMAINQAMPDERKQLSNELNATQAGIGRTAGSLQNILHKEGMSSRQRENADYNHQLALERMAMNQAGAKDLAQVKAVQKAEIAASKPKKFNDKQNLSGGFAKRMEQSEEAFKGLADQGYKREDHEEGILSAILPDSMKESNLKQQEQAERNFVNAVLRAESGAAIAPHEFESAEKQYFPRAGDSPEVLAQKERNRNQAFLSMKSASGGAYDLIPTAEIVPVKKNGETNFDAMTDDELLEAYNQKMGVK